jgi:hypothetical protein
LSSWRNCSGVMFKPSQASRSRDLRPREIPQLLLVLYGKAE